MRSWWLLLVSSLAFAHPGIAQESGSATKAAEVSAGVSTPSALGALAEYPGALPGGQTVSQPLQPVELPGESSIPTPNDTSGLPHPGTLSGKTETIIRGLGDSWDSLDLLIWWPKAQPLPPLLAANRVGAPILGANGTHVLIGGRNQDALDQAGGKFVLGGSLNDSNTLGIEGSYFFLGTRTSRATASDRENPNLGNVGFPYFDPNSNALGAMTVAQSGISSARIDLSTSTRLQGAEFNVVASLVDGTNLKLAGLLGYRYFQLQEGLQLDSTFVSYPRLNGMPTGLYQTADSFDAHNRFNGGQLGLSLDLNRGPLFVEWVGKLALGGNFEVVKVQGQTNALVGYQPLPLAVSYPSGIYAQPSNIGRYTRSVFAVVPETTFKFGFKLNDYGRVFAAYNFLYLSDAIRPGDQVDTTLNPSQVRLLNPSGALSGPERPLPLINRSDFWVQGLVFGLEGRY